jgi:hypothetical protein
MRRACFSAAFFSLILSVTPILVTGCSRAPAPATSSPAPAKPAPAKSAPIENPAPPPPPPAPANGAHHARKFATANPSASSSEYQLGDEVEAWKNNLKSGAIEYYVPPAMVAQQVSPVTVNIHGYQDTKSQALPNPTGTGALKVSSQMKVELFAPLNPGEFTITQQGTNGIQFVPNDGFASWTWNVTPSEKAQNQQLQIRVSLVYPGKSGNVEQILEEKSYAVNVNVQKLTVTIEQSFWKDPIAWFKYVLPGGAGWAAIAALITSLGGLTWWKKKRDSKPPPEVK